MESELAQPVSVGPASVQAALAQAVVAEPELADISDDEREFSPDGFELDEVAPDVDDHEEPNDDLDSELLLIESVPPLTPVIASDVRAVPAEASWTEADGPLGFSLAESEPLALEMAELCAGDGQYVSFRSGQVRSRNGPGFERELRSHRFRGFALGWCRAELVSTAPSIGCVSGGWR